MGEWCAEAGSTGIGDGPEKTLSRARPDPDEELEVGAFPPAAIPDMIARSEIVHGPSVAGLLLSLRNR